MDFFVSLNLLLYDINYIQILFVYKTYRDI